MQNSPQSVSPCAARSTRLAPAGRSDARSVHTGVAFVTGNPRDAAVVGIAAEIDAVADAAVDVAADAVGQALGGAARCQDLC